MERAYHSDWSGSTCSGDCGAQERQKAGFAGAPFTVDLTGCRVHVFNTLRGALIAEPLIRNAEGFDTEDTEEGHRGTAEIFVAGDATNSDCFLFATGHGSTVPKRKSTGLGSEKGQF